MTTTYLDQLANLRRFGPSDGGILERHGSHPCSERNSTRSAVSPGVEEDRRTFSAAGKTSSMKSLSALIAGPCENRKDDVTDCSAAILGASVDVTARAAVSTRVNVSLVETVKAYPAISQKNGEAVWVAGIRTDTTPEWVRLAQASFKKLPSSQRL